MAALLAVAAVAVFAETAAVAEILSEFPIEFLLRQGFVELFGKLVVPVVYFFAGAAVGIDPL